MLYKKPVMMMMIIITCITMALLYYSKDAYNSFLTAIKHKSSGFGDSRGEGQIRPNLIQWWGQAGGRWRKDGGRGREEEGGWGRGWGGDQDWPHDATLHDDGAATQAAAGCRAARHSGTRSGELMLSDNLV